MFIGVNQIINRFAGMKHRSVVFAAESHADRSERRLGVLFAQVHGYLAGAGDLARAF